MKWSDLIRLAATNLWRRKLRSVLTMIGVMIGTASIVVMVSIGIGINQGYIDSLSQSGELTTININSTTYYGGGGMVIIGGASSGEEPSRGDQAGRPRRARDRGPGPRHRRLPPSRTSTT